MIESSSGVWIDYSKLLICTRTFATCFKMLLISAKKLFTPASEEKTETWRDQALSFSVRRAGDMLSP